MSRGPIEMMLDEACRCRFCGALPFRCRCMEPSRAVVCPHCEAEPRKPCQMRDGTPMGWEHKRRVRAASVAETKEKGKPRC